MVDLIQYRVRITPPREEMENEQMDLALRDLRGQRAVVAIQRFVEKRLFGTDNLEGFTVTVEEANE